MPILLSGNRQSCSVSVSCVEVCKRERLLVSESRITLVIGEKGSLVDYIIVIPLLLVSGFWSVLLVQLTDWASECKWIPSLRPS
jgi:hypothetical protein